MDIWIYMSVFLFAVCMVLLFRLIVIKRNLKEIRCELLSTRERDYNRQLTVTLIDKDVTELAAEMNENLDYQKGLKIEAEKSENKLKQSVADIAHDLRTPLTVIKGNLQLLENEQLNEKSKDCVRICQDKAETLKLMIDDFFEMSVLESDNSPVVLQPVNITNTLMQFVVDHEALIRDKGLVPDIIFPDKTIMAMAEPKLFNRMLTNLLGNILKYARESFVIQLEELGEAKRCRITLSNKIVAGTKVDAGKLFDRTYRADKSRSTAGAGLGLYIVKLLADKQDMNVSASIRDCSLNISIEMDLEKK